MVFNGDNWQKSYDTSVESFNKSIDDIVSTNWSKIFDDSTKDFEKGFTIFLKEGVIGAEGYKTLTDGYWTGEDAKIMFMAYITFASNHSGGGRNNVLETQIKGKTLKLRNKEAENLVNYLGYEVVPNHMTFNKQPIYYNKKAKKYISPDIDSHNGGTWKMGDSVKDINSKDNRLGTFDALLNKIGD